MKAFRPTSKIPIRILVPGLVLLFLLGSASSCAPPTKLDAIGMSFSKEPLIGKIIWNDLITEDLKAAQRFYGELFGWTFESASNSMEHEYVLAKSGDIYVAGFVSINKPADNANYSRWLPYLSVADVDSATRRVTAAGGRIAVPPQDVKLGRVAAIVDPEGAVIGLARSKIGDPDDQTTANAPGRVVLTELLANNPQAEAGFYKTVIGYVPRTIERRGGQYTQLTTAGKVRAGILRNPSAQAAPRWITYFGVVDPAAFAARAEALGGAVILPVSPDLRDGTMALVSDPSGAILALQKTNP
jgi:predicted enzyme related to lactoylglutathione lyase